jgi:hypothetical protein
LFHAFLLALEFFDLEAFPLARCLCGGSVAKDTLDAALFLFVFGFCSFSLKD